MTGSKTELRDAIRNLQSGIRGDAALPDTPVVERAAERIEIGALGAQTPREGTDYDQVAQEILDLCARGAPLDWKRARDGAWCLWTTSPALCEQDAGLSAVLKGVSDSERRQPFRALASSWMSSFDPGRRGVHEASEVLRAKAPAMGAPWQALQANYDLFHPETGPGNVANAAVSQRLSPSALLARSGLGAFDAGGGYVRSCLAACLERLADGAEPEPMARLAMARSLALKPDGKLLFEELGPLVVSALLKPFGQTTPAKTVRDVYLALLLDLFGDPRLHAGRWTRMRDAEAVVKKWLTEQSLRQFLELADRAAMRADPALKHMWPERRKFWEAVYKAELISEAWVVFGADGARLARQAFGDAASFGRFNREGRKQVDSGHTVLLLHIGRGVVADWSFNGKCNIWSEADDRGAPKLYLGVYSSDDVRMPSSVGPNIGPGPFSASHIGNWQRRVAEKLRDMTGVRIPGYY